MKPEELAKVAAKLPLSESVRRLNGLSGHDALTVGASEQAGGIKVAGDQSKSLISHPSAISTDEAKLNKTERAYLAYLRTDRPHDMIHIQSLTLKLADDCRYTPDFVTVDYAGETIGWEVKGFMRDDALVKIKVAARMFLWIRFVLVRRIKGQWEFQEVKP